MKKYKIVTGWLDDDGDGFEKEVQDLLNQGYELYGFPSIAMDWFYVLEDGGGNPFDGEEPIEIGSRIMQALIKND